MGAIESLFVDLFLDAHERAPERLVLDLDATDDPLHGRQEGRFFHGYYDCYCYLPLYIFCGDHLLAAKLRRANIDASAGAVEEVERIVGQIRARWPAVEVVLRAGSPRRHGPADAERDGSNRRGTARAPYVADGTGEFRWTRAGVVARHPAHGGVAGAPCLRGRAESRLPAADRRLPATRT